MGGKLIELHLYKVEEKEKISRDLDKDIINLFDASQKVSAQVTIDLGWFYGIVDEKGDFLCRESHWRRWRTRYLHGKVYDGEIVFKLFNRCPFGKREEIIVVPDIDKKEACSSSGNRYEVKIKILESNLEKTRYKEYSESLIEDAKMLPKWRREQIVRDGTSFCDVVREAQKSEDAKAAREAMGEESFKAEAAGRR